MKTKTTRTLTLHLSKLIKASLMAAVTAAFAFITVPLPFSPVPITLQSLGIMLAGIILGPQLGTLAVFVYLVLGFAGLPVFAQGQTGIGVLVGPTGGFVVGFLPGAWVTGAISRAINRRLWKKDAKTLLFFANLASCVTGGILVVHLFGLMHLAKHTGLSFRDAAVIGTLPFLPGDMFKAIAASALTLRISGLYFPTEL